MNDVVYKAVIGDSTSTVSGLFTCRDCADAWVLEAICSNPHYSDHVHVSAVPLHSCNKAPLHVEPEWAVADMLSSASLCSDPLRAPSHHEDPPHESVPSPINPRNDAPHERQVVVMLDLPTAAPAVAPLCGLWPSPVLEIRAYCPTNYSGPLPSNNLGHFDDGAHTTYKPDAPDALSPVMQLVWDVQALGRINREIEFIVVSRNNLLVGLPRVCMEDMGVKVIVVPDYASAMRFIEQ